MEGTIYRRCRRVEAPYAKPYAEPYVERSRVEPYRETHVERS